MSRSPVRRRGAVIIQVCLVLVLLLGFTALTTDYGIQVVRQRRLQNVTDAAALAAGPDLVKSGSQAAATAVNYAAYNGVSIPTPAVANNTITVTASEVVQTPFAAVLNASWATSTVHAKSVVRATMAVDSGFLRPLSIPCGPYGISNVDKYIGQPVHMKLKLQTNGKSYSDQPADVQDDLIYINPIDFTAYGSVPGYKQSLKYGLSGDLSYQPKGGSTWLASMMFYDFNGKNEADWLVNLDLWQKATHEAIVSDDDSIMKRGGAGTQYANDTWDNITPGNPRFVILLEENRVTGGPNKIYDTQFKGYVGFLIEGMDYDPATHFAQINGRFVSPATRARMVPSNIPEGVNDGVYTFALIE